MSPATTTPTAGNVFEVTITALDAADALDPAYTGPHCLTFSGPDDAPDGTAPTYPTLGDCTTGSSVSFSAGVATVNVTLVDPGATVLEVTDGSSGLFGASVPLIVSAPGAAMTTTGSTTTPTTTTSVPSTTTTSGPGTVPASTTTTMVTSTSTPVDGAAAGFFSVIAATSTPAVGTSFSVTITAVDGDGNTDTAYTGPECLTFSARRPRRHGPDLPGPGRLHHREQRELLRRVGHCQRGPDQPGDDHARSNRHFVGNVRRFCPAQCLRPRARHYDLYDRNDDHDRDNYDHVGHYGPSGDDHDRLHDDHYGRNGDHDFGELIVPGVSLSATLELRRTPFRNRWLYVPGMAEKAMVPVAEHLGRYERDGAARGRRCPHPAGIGQHLSGGRRHGASGDALYFGCIYEQGAWPGAWHFKRVTVICPPVPSWQTCCAPTGVLEHGGRRYG